jgi:hypothetical protein
VVVDNGGDAIERLLAAELPGARTRVEVLSPGSNLGYAGGMNLGIRTLLGSKTLRVVVLLNNDTVVAPDVFCDLYEALRDGSGVHLATPLIRRADSDQTWSAGERVWYPLLWARRQAPPAAGIAAALARRINGVTGCAMAIRREVFERIGLFDENYFAYVEDVDFSWRAHAAGFGFACCLRSVVRHKVSASLGNFTPVKVYLNVRNKAYFLARHIAPRWWPLAWPWYAATIALWAGRAIVQRKPEILRAVQAGLRDAVRKRMGPPSLRL